MKKDFTKRLGSFMISRSDIEDYPDKVQELLKDVIVIRAELMWDSAVEYTGLSDGFYVVGPNMMAIPYTVMKTIDGKWFFEKTA